MTPPRARARRLGCALAIGCAAAGCAPPAPRDPGPPPAASLHVTPLTDLAPAASLVWLLDVKPRALALDGRLAGPIGRVLPDERLRAFARSSGGVDLREVEELTVAEYPSATLLLARTFVDPARVEAAFRQRAVTLEGRAVDGPPGDPRGDVTRLWGATATGQEQVAVFGFEAVGVERGRFGPLRAAELFAQGKLKRASPALRAPPLAHLAELLGDADVRAFAPGPFTGELERAAGGLLAATTAAGIGARSAAGPAGHGGVAFHVVLLGDWGADAAPAARRLRAVFDVTSGSDVGRLLGLDRCVAGPTVTGTPEALTVDFALDADVLAGGLRAATGAEVSEIMAP